MYRAALAELDLPLEAPLSLRIGVAACESQPVTFEDTVTLAVDEQDGGGVCRALERGALEWHVRTRGSCGERNMPCGDCESADMTSCAADLVGGLMACQEGVCRAEVSF